jgi:hypothetical protein
MAISIKTTNLIFFIKNPPCYVCIPKGR